MDVLQQPKATCMSVIKRMESETEKRKGQAERGQRGEEELLVNERLKVTDDTLTLCLPTAHTCCLLTGKRDIDRFEQKLSTHHKCICIYRIIKRSATYKTEQTVWADSH